MRDNQMDEQGEAVLLSFDMSSHFIHYDPCTLPCPIPQHSQSCSSSPPDDYCLL